jgi:hypothetical protein
VNSGATERGSRSVTDSVYFIKCVISRKLTIVDDEGDMGDLRVLNLDVVHDENLRRQLPR